MYLCIGIDNSISSVKGQGIDQSVCTSKSGRAWNNVDCPKMFPSNKFPFSGLLVEEIRAEGNLHYDIAQIQN